MLVENYFAVSARCIRIGQHEQLLIRVFYRVGAVIRVLLGCSCSAMYTSLDNSSPVQSGYPTDHSQRDCCAATADENDPKRKAHQLSHPEKPAWQVQAARTVPTAGGPSASRSRQFESLKTDKRQPVAKRPRILK